MCQRDQRVRRVEVALERTVIRLERPEGEQDIAIDAVAPFDLIKYAVIGARIGASSVDADLRDQTASMQWAT